jgi:hypothetical protein
LPFGELPLAAAGLTQAKTRRGLWPLQLMNFFMADLHAGTGPFVSTCRRTPMLKSACVAAEDERSP